eukprot:1312536-Heterocapsa_arctica.AAC.1
MAAAAAKRQADDLDAERKELAAVATNCLKQIEKHTLKHEELMKENEAKRKEAANNRLKLIKERKFKND